MPDYTAFIVELVSGELHPAQVRRRIPYTTVPSG